MKLNQPKEVSTFYFQTTSTMSWETIARLHLIPEPLEQSNANLSRENLGLYIGQYLLIKSIRGLDLFQELIMASLIRFRTERVDSTLPFATICIFPSILDWLIFTFVLTPSFVNLLVNSSWNFSSSSLWIR